MNNEVLSLHVFHDVFLLMFQNGTAQIHLVVNAHHYTQTDILTDLIPVQVVPETLLQPMEANLSWSESRHFECRGHQGEFYLEDEFNVVTCAGEYGGNPTAHQVRGQVNRAVKSWNPEVTRTT